MKILKKNIYLFPNLRVMKCTNIIVKTLYKNLGFFVTLLFLINFILCILQRLCLNNCFCQKENSSFINRNEELKKEDVEFLDSSENIEIIDNNDNINRNEELRRGDVISLYSSFNLADSSLSEGIYNNNENNENNKSIENNDNNDYNESNNENNENNENNKSIENNYNNDYNESNNENNENNESIKNNDNNDNNNYNESNNNINILILRDNKSSIDCKKKKNLKKKDTKRDNQQILINTYDYDDQSSWSERYLVSNSSNRSSIRRKNELEKGTLYKKISNQKTKIKYQNYMTPPPANPPKKPEDSIIITKISFYTLSLSFFIFLNIFFAFNMSMLHIYYKFKFWCFVLNLLAIPLIISVGIILFKKYICYINMENYYIIIDILELLFLIFNFILVSSFCGIYVNSVSKLGINIIFSIIGYFFIGLIVYLLKKYCGKKIKKISNLFYPFDDKIEEEEEEYNNNNNINTSNNNINNNLE